MIDRNVTGIREQQKCHNTLLPITHFQILATYDPDLITLARFGTESGPLVDLTNCSMLRVAWYIVVFDMHDTETDNKHNTT